MPTEYFSQFCSTICAGLGLLLVGGVNLLLLRRSLAVRLVASLLAVGATLGIATATLPGLATNTLLILVAVLVPCLLLRSRQFVPVVQTLQRPVVLFGLLTLAGIGTAISSVAVFEAVDQKVTANSLADLDLANDITPTVVTALSAATTDRGTPVVLREPAPGQPPRDLFASETKILTTTKLADQVIRRGPGGDHANCHGWVFTAGKFRIASEDVQIILNENGYSEVRDPHPGDVVIYRQHGNIAHSAIVRYVTEGQSVMVEGKWGGLGILLHAVEKSVYGDEFTYYRSQRTGHSLVGIDGRSLPANKIQRTVATE